MWRSRTAAFVIFTSAMFSGCGDNDGRIAVSGRVTLDGIPLEKGQILLVPARDNAGTAAGAVISAGRFRIPANEGPTAGAYEVTITVGDGPKKKLTNSRGEVPVEKPPRASATYSFTRDITDNVPLDFELR